MNAGDYMQSLLNSTQNIKYKSVIQPTSITECSYLNKCSIQPSLSHTLNQKSTISTITPTDICSNQTYKETILKSPVTNQKQTCPSSTSIINTPTEICSQTNYKIQLKRIQNNIML